MRRFIQTSLLALVSVSLSLCTPQIGRCGFITITSGNLGIGSWGPANSTYGQTFLLPDDDNFLISFSFDILSLNDSFPFVSQIYEWKNNRPFGPALYTSSISTSPAPSSQYTRFTYNANVFLSPGKRYVAWVTNYPNGVSVGGNTDGSVAGQMLGKSGNPYSDGQFVWSLGTDPTTSDWSISANNQDAVFNASFTAVPEPSPLLLSSILVGGLLFRIRRST